MKKSIKHLSKSTLAVVLSLCMLISCAAVGIVATDAAKVTEQQAVSAAVDNETVGAAVDNETVGAAVDNETVGAAADNETVGAAVEEEPVGSGSGYILYGTSNNPSEMSDTGVNVTKSGNTYTATIPSSKITKTGTNYYFALSSSTSYTNIFASAGYFSSGNITVTTSGSGISGSGRQEFNVGDDKYQFVRISFSTISSFTISFNNSTRAYTIETGAETKYNVTVSAGTGGTVVAGNTTVNAGSSTTVSVGATAVSLTAKPATGYSFNGWTKSGGAALSSTTSTSSSLTATATGTVTASFKEDEAATRRIYFDNTTRQYNPPYAKAYTGTKTYFNGKMTNLKDNIWYVDVSTDATNIEFYNGASTSSTTGGLTIPTGTNDYYQNDNTWGKYTETTYPNVYKATLGSTITSNSNLYTNIDATFYDYYTDREVNGNWYTSIDSWYDGWIKNGGGGIGTRNPYTNLNSALSSYASNKGVYYPMYFGSYYYDDNNSGNSYYHDPNYTHSSTSYSGQLINDSNQLGDYHKPLTGLSGKTLTNGNINYYSSAGTNENGATMPLFDEQWLYNTNSTGKTLGSVVKSNFPVRKMNKYSTSTLYLDVSTVGSGGSSYWAHFYTGSSSTNVKMNLVSTNLYSVTNPGGYTNVVFTRNSNGNAPDSTWSNVWNQTDDLTLPDGSDNKIMYKTSSWGSGKLMNGSWSAYTSATSSTYYQFNSDGATDNVYFDNLTSGSPVLQYGAGTTYGQRSGYANTYGFYPFDRYDTNKNTESYSKAYAKDQAFGLKLEINFTLGTGGKVNGSDQVFEYTGDDDLWVFVDDQLVLDLGGDHKWASGNINFATKTATATDPRALNSATRNGSFSIDNNNVNKIHKLTIFYLERGMHESNLKFGFSFTPVGNELITEQNVSYNNVNTGLVSRVKELAADDTFSLVNQKSDSLNGTYSRTFGSSYAYNLLPDEEERTPSTGSGTYVLKDGQSADFLNRYTKNEYIQVTSTGTYQNNFKYNTTLRTVTDEVLGSTKTVTDVTNPNGGKFQFITNKSNPGDLDATIIKAVFDSTVLTKDLMITKAISGYVDDTSTFGITVNFKLPGDTSYTVYPVTYTVNGGSTKTLGSLGRIDGIKRNDVILITGIPEKTEVQVTEYDMPDNYDYLSSEVVDDSDNDISITELDPGSGCQFKIGTTESGDTSDYYVDTITNTPFRYKVIYNYPSRLYGRQAYEKSGVITDYDSTATGWYENSKLKKTFVQSLQPYEDNFIKDMAWDYNNEYSAIPATIDDNTAAGINYSYDENTKTLNAYVICEEAQIRPVSLRFVLPYDFEEETVGGVVIPVATGTDYNDDPDECMISQIDRYRQTYFGVDSATGNVVYATAPSSLKLDGTDYSFLYWKITYIDNPNLEIARCYSNDFNYNLFDDYEVTPVYSCDGSGSLTTDSMATITYLEQSRNQWNEYHKGDRNTQKASIDTIYTDFNLSFQNKGELIDWSSATVVGIAIENCTALTQNGSTYNTNVNTYTLSNPENVKNLFKTYLKSERTANDLATLRRNLKNNNYSRNATFFDIDHDYLTNKNRLEYYVGISANEDDLDLNNKTSLFRAYAYIVTTDGEVIISDPVKFEIYTEAMKVAG